MIFKIVLPQYLFSEERQCKQKSHVLHARGWMSMVCYAFRIISMKTQTHCCYSCCSARLWDDRSFCQNPFYGNFSYIYIHIYFLLTINLCISKKGYKQTEHSPSYSCLLSVFCLLLLLFLI